MRHKKLSSSERGWITRRAREAEREREQERQRRSDAAQRGWELRRKKEAEREREQERQRRSDAAQRGWKLRRKKEAERERERVKVIRRKAGKKAARTRRRHETERAEKEVRRLAKWRKSYQEYLEFRVSKKEREKLMVPEKRELICKVLFDADALEEREEHFWSNIRYLIGDSISNQLARIVAEEGTTTVWFRVILADEYKALLVGQVEDPSDMGKIIEVSYDTELDADAFWSMYFDYARNYVPKDAAGGSDGSLLVVKMQVCYLPGEV